MILVRRKDVTCDIVGSSPEVEKTVDVTYTTAVQCLLPAVFSLLTIYGRCGSLAGIHWMMIAHVSTSMCNLNSQLGVLISSTFITLKPRSCS